jgi:citrate synthase
MAEYKIASSMCQHDETSVAMRGLDLCTEIIGRMSLSEAMIFAILGVKPTPLQCQVFDAVTITLMDHGLSPSAISTRLVMAGAPESLQGAVCAGLLAIGDRFAGTVELSAAVLDEIAQGTPPYRTAAKAVMDRLRAEKKTVPGFGHPEFRGADPRAVRLMKFADEIGLTGKFIDAARALDAEMTAKFGTKLPMNATLACAALLRQIDFPGSLTRGIILIGRTAGLVAHVYEELRNPAWRGILNLVREHADERP